MRCIEMTAHDNPKDTQTAMDWLARVRGVEDYELFVHVDAGCPETLGVLRAHPLPHVRLLKQFKLGRNTNTYEALRHGFEECKSSYVISLDDRSLPKPDFLDFHEHCAKQYKNSQNVFCASAWCNQSDKSEAHTLSFRPKFLPMGWGTWRDRWKKMRDKWVIDDSCSWREHITDKVIGEMKEVYPLLSRSNLIDGLFEYDDIGKGKWHE